MHNHTNHSRDSECKLEDLYKAQIDKGTHIFAVTDHFNNADSRPGNDFDSIKESVEEVLAFRERCNGKHLILAGVEAGESIMDIDAHNKLISLANFDVVVGSIHKVSHKDFNRNFYISIDFSKLSLVDISRFINSYFDDIIRMIEIADFDILAHLTCPFRYIWCKHGISICEEEYSEKIETILKMIIKRRIALEVNTPYLERIGDFTPSKEILMKYREFGGKLITLGSDSHTPNTASAFFPQAVKLLKDTGFDNIYYYQNRKPHSLEL